MIMSLKKKEFCTMRMMMGRKEQHTKRISFFFEDSSCALWIEVESLTMPEREREIHTGYPYTYNTACSIGLQTTLT